MIGPEKMADCFSDVKLRASLEVFLQLAKADYSGFSALSLDTAAERIKTVSEYVKNVNTKLRVEIGPRAAEVSNKLNNLSEHLKK
jgi:hypothetical protein